MSIVEVTIDPTGEVQTVDVQGHQGSGCKAIAGIFSTGAPEKATIKPEYSGGPGPSSVSVGS